MHSIFNQVDVFFNQKPVSPPNNAYGYRSYIKTLLNYESADKKFHLTIALWYTDTPGKMDTTNDKNEGFCLMDPTGLYTARITEAALFVRRVRLSPSIILAHKKHFRRQQLNIPSHV